jgi:CheY-like chemotaxis protein
VTDLHMPGIDGVAVARGARAHRPPIPVVLLSAYPMHMGHPQVQEAGATIHVAKPFANRDSCRRSNERWRGISSDRERLSPEVIDGTQTDGTV